MNSTDHGRPGRGTRLKPGSPEVPAWLAMAVEEALYEFRRPMHHTRSHSFASLASPRPSGASTVMMAILPVLSISTRAICTPAAVTALTALVTSCCRNVEGARATGAPHKAGRRDWE